MLSHFRIIKTGFVLVFFVSAMVACSPRLQKPVFDDGGYSSTTTTVEQVAYNALDDGILKACAIKANNNYYLDIRVEIPAEKIKYFRVDTGECLFIKLSDNSVLSLSNNSKVRAAVVNNISEAYRSADVICPLSNDNIKKINSHDITAISVKVNNGSFDFGVESKGSKTLQKLVSLITTPSK